MIKKFFTPITLLLTIIPLDATTIKYQFDINKKNVTFLKKTVPALTINNQIPGPTIIAHVGQTLEVTFNNKLDEETSIHWHGVLLPNDQDGVPYLTTKPIKAHSSFTYSFKVTHSGTYWYHSHTELQEQRGLYGALVFYPSQGEQILTDYDHVVILSDWTNEHPNRVMANLKKDGDYYALKKGTVQSWFEVLKNGRPAIKNRLNNALIRMGPMDLSDIGYDAFLANGKQESFLEVPPKKTIRIRLINAAASSYFNVECAEQSMTIVSADGVDIEPLKVKRLRIAIAETYDVIISIPDKRAYELRATAEDGTGHSSIFIGSGEKVFAPTITKPNLFLMHHNNHNTKNHSQNSMANMHMMKMQPEVIKYMKDYNQIRSLRETTFSPNSSLREITLNLTGFMERYIWSFNNKTLFESDKILIKKGEIIRITLQNQTMMHHPIHLHGHFFRVINGQHKKSPLKHTVNVPSMGKVTIEFEANEEKDWFFHCHNLYHMKAGMARVFSYENSTTATPEVLQKLNPDSWYFLSNISLFSNMTLGLLRASKTYDSFIIEYDYNYKKAYDIETIYTHNFTRYFFLYAGAKYERKINDKKTEKLTILGIQYVLPFFIETDLRLSSNGRFRFSLQSFLQLTDRTKFEWSYNTDKEYRFSFSYEISKQFLLTALYDSDFKWGAGLKIRF